MSPLQQPWYRLPLTAGSTLAMLWLVFGIYAGGNPLWAVVGLFAGSLVLYVYLSARTLAWRYLFPGVAAMLAFVAFPLIYTVQIGFTNYSSSNLLGEDQARKYLLDRGEFAESDTFEFSLHDEGSALRLVLSSANIPRFISPPLPARTDTTPIPLEALGGGQPPPGAALSLKDVIAQRGRLLPLRLQLPDQQILTYAGLREFSRLDSLWRAGEGGSLIEAATGVVYRPNRNAGFFESAAGDRLQPGFKVNVGMKNYVRMFGDADMRGPFLSIFIWTIVFAGLTVAFSTAIGMTLAVALNWEALRFRGLYRTLLFLPYAVPGFISILVFKGLFNQNFGEINAILSAMFDIRPAWFAEPILAKVMILVVNTWLGYPYIMVLCTGLIKAIPADLYEASAIAGAKPLTNFWKITAPLIVKPLTPLLISAFAFNFNNFVLISLLTDGRPDYLNTKLPAGTTDILVSYTYRIAFTDAGQNFGLAAAISTVIFFLVAVLSMANLKLTRSNSKE
jgi:maltose/maltodextrin transport system permease protein